MKLYPGGPEISKYPKPNFNGPWRLISIGPRIGRWMRIVSSGPIETSRDWYAVYGPLVEVK